MLEQALAAGHRPADYAVHAVDSGIPVVLGGQAAAELATAELPGADAWAADDLRAVEVITELAKSRRNVWLLESDDTAGQVYRGFP